MSLLDDARKVMAAGPPCTRDIQDVATCALCGGKHYGGMEEDSVPQKIDHSPDCPWLAMPRIVAALEAAEPLCHHMLIEEVFPARQALSRIMLGDEGVPPLKEDDDE